MSNFLLALILGGSVAGYLYYRLDQHSIERQKRNAIASLVVGIFAFIIIFSIATKYNS